MPDAPREIEAAQLTDAHAMVLRLLGQGTADDIEHGPRWRRLHDGEVWAHLYDHLDSIGCRRARVDEDSGLLEAAHVAVRALQILQLAIEEARDG